MVTTSQALAQNASLLTTKASKQSLIGTVIGIIAVVIATVLSGHFENGEISLSSLIHAQKSNPVLWFLDVIPFIFAFWGQHVGSMISYEASAMVIDQTQELRTHAAALEKKAAHEATHDALTNLPNRTLFIDRLEQAIYIAKREEEKIAIFILDVDRFKEVNDTLGHYNGDRLIKQLALRLSNVIRESDTIARIGGDEFAFVLPKPGNITSVENLAKKIKKSLTLPFSLENLSLDVQASIGAAIYPDHGKDADTLIQLADVAMYAAKQDKLGFVIYSESLDRHSPHRLTLMGELREAILEDDLVLYYQPKILTASHRAYAVEALVRWEHKKHGLMPPDEFIPIAERTGLIQDLTIWVLRQSLKQCAEWHKNGIRIDIAVNISSLCLLDPEFPEIVTGTLAAYDFPAKSLTMEITETSIMVAPDRSLEILNRIHDIGVKFSIDDFGTGYSSLAYLKKLPVNEIKIDRSFVTDMANNESDATIVNATIQLGHNLGLTVVAEGVEDRHTFEKLSDMKCDIIQGYYISKPMPLDDLMAWMKTGKY